MQTQLSSLWVARKDAPFKNQINLFDVSFSLLPAFILAFCNVIGSQLGMEPQSCCGCEYMIKCDQSAQRLKAHQDEKSKVCIRPARA